MMNNNFKTILTSRIGSHCHGINTQESDEDIRSIVIPTIDYFFGTKNFEQKVEKIDGNDVEHWNITKFVGLLIKGNPSAMNILCVNKKDILYADEFGQNLLDNKKLFLSQRIIDVCIGYVTSQLHKIDLGRGTKEGNRSAMIEKYGYDCYTEETDFLTDSGWKKYNEITKEDKLATINPITFDIEYQPFFDRVEKKYNDKIYTIENRWTKFEVTPNHRIFSSPMRKSINGYKYLDSYKNWSFNPLIDLLENKRKAFHILSSFQNSQIDYKVSDSYLNLLGAFASEGTFGKFRNNKFNCVRISQTNHGKESFFKLMNSLPKSYGFKKYSYIRNKNLTETIWITYNKKITNKLFEDCNHLSKNKSLPDWVCLLSSRQANLLLNSLHLGDGTFTKQRGFDYRTKSKKLAEKVQILALLCGFNCNITYYKKHKQMYRVYYSNFDLNPKSICFNKKTKIKNYNGNVVCFSVKNENLITRLDGKIAIQGNTKFIANAVMMANIALEVIKTNDYHALRPPEEQKYLRAIRAGEVPLKDARDQIKSRLETIKVIESTCKLPKHPDEEKINDFLTDFLQDYFQKELSNEFI